MALMKGMYRHISEYFNTLVKEVPFLFKIIFWYCNCSAFLTPCLENMNRLTFLLI